MNAFRIRVSSVPYRFLKTYPRTTLRFHSTSPFSYNLQPDERAQYENELTYYKNQPNPDQHQIYNILIKLERWDEIKHDIDTKLASTNNIEQQLEANLMLGNYYIYKNDLKEAFKLFSHVYEGIAGDDKENMNVVVSIVMSICSMNKVEEARIISDMFLDKYKSQNDMLELHLASLQPLIELRDIDVLNNPLKIEKRHVNAATQFRPYDWQSYFIQARYLHVHGELQQALSAINKSLDMAEGSSREYLAVYSKALILMDMKNYQKAKEMYQRVTELDPKDTDPYTLTIVAASYSFLKDYDKAIEKLTKNIEENPSHRQSYLQRGLLYRAKKDNPAALRDFEHLVKSNPQSMEARILYSESLFSMGHSAEAVESWAELTRLKPDYAPGWFKLAQAELKLGLSMMASKAFKTQTEGMKYFQKSYATAEKTVALDPKLTQAYFFLAEADKIMKRWDRAESHLKKGLELEPKSQVGKDLAEMIAEGRNK
jgi:tetratricopeptide (TPR) repeat protein